MNKFGGFLSRIERELAQLNDHMPRTKKSLAELCNDPQPAFITRDGKTSSVRSSEIEFLAKLIPPKLHSEIMLPFTILRRTAFGKGAHTIGGSKLEQFTVLHILGKITAPFSAWRETELSRIIYSPEVAHLRKKLPTTSTIGFGT